MDFKKITAFLIAFGLVGLSMWMLSRPRALWGGADAPVRMDFPPAVNGFEARRLFFCQNEQCAASFLESALETTNFCPRCESALDTLSLGEKNLLPANTPILRRAYVNREGRRVMVTVVFSGRERRSIHKPQVCLVGQGHSIRDARTISVDMPDRSPLDVKLLSIARPAAGGERLGFYAYWFFNPERETASHYVRLARMAWDNVIRGYRPRWGYVVIATDRLGQADEAALRILRSFIPAIYPAIEEVRERLRQYEARTVLDT